MLWAVELELPAKEYIAAHRKQNPDVESIATEILRLRVSPNRLPSADEIEAYDDGFFLWRIHGHTLLLQQRVTAPENGVAKATTHVHAIVIGSAAQGESGLAFLRAMFSL